MKVSENDMHLCATKISIALLRWTDLIPADKAFYEAGMAAKVSVQFYIRLQLLVCNTSL